MDRNFFRRVETGFPMENNKLKKRIIKDGLELYLQDNTQAWVLHSDGRYIRLKANKEEAVSSQNILLMGRAKSS